MACVFSDPFNLVRYLFVLVSYEVDDNLKHVTDFPIEISPFIVLNADGDKGNQICRQGKLINMFSGSISIESLKVLREVAE